MENQTRFDLNAAVESWRQELAAQPDVTPDRRRELETHLRDTFAAMKKLGLTDDEAFWVANQRIGRPEQLNKEFGKNDHLRPAFVHQTLMISGITALFALLFQKTIPPAFAMNSMATLQSDTLNNWNAYCIVLAQTFFWLALILIACFSLFTFRRRFVLVTAALFFSLSLLRAFIYTESQQRMFQTVALHGRVFKTRGGAILHPPVLHPPDWIHDFWQSFSSFFSISNPMWFVILILLIASLLSARNQATHKTHFKMV